MMPKPPFRVIYIKSCEECPYKQKHRAINKLNYGISYCSVIPNFPDICNTECVLYNCPLDVIKE